jgi:hypothetical protein
VTFDSTQGANLGSGGPVDLVRGEGWAQVTFAINSILQLSTPVFLRIDADAHEPLFIDFRHRAFVWSTDLINFPADARNVSFETEPVSADAPPLFKLPGEGLDSLLWVLGQNAYGGHPAPWLRPGERYRLAQWPNLTKHLHDMNQMHMLAVLGNGYFAAPELAAAAGVPETKAHDLINALSLLRLLRVSEGMPAIIVPIEQKEKSNPSLFARLRARLGR